MSLRDRLEWLDSGLAESAEKCNVPGVVVGVLCGDETEVFAHGVTNIDEPQPVTGDTVFQIGSNTKLYTATLVMQLVEAGLVDLDTSIVSYIPTFRLADAGAEAVTVRHLLTHTAGIDGDHRGPADLGFQDDMIEVYVDSLQDVHLLHPPGQKWSYCNAGFVLLGRLVEVIRGMPYHAALKRHITDPIGAPSTCMLPDDVAALPAAMGHLPGPDPGEIVVAPVYTTAPACAPAGSVPVATASDVLRFISAHLASGTTGDGGRILSAGTVAQMQTRQTDVWSNGHVNGWGLGWMLGATVDAQRTISHGGGTFGQISLLEVLPDAGVAVTVLTNGPGGGALGLPIVERVLRELAGAVMPPSPTPPTEPAAIDLAPYVGRYQRIGTTVDISISGENLAAYVTEDWPVEVGGLGPQSLTLVPVESGVFAEQRSGTVVRFVDPDEQGRPAYLYNFRLLKRER